MRIHIQVSEKIGCIHVCNSPRNPVYYILLLQFYSNFYYTNPVRHTQPKQTKERFSTSMLQNCVYVKCTHALQLNSPFFSSVSVRAKSCSCATRHLGQDIWALAVTVAASQAHPLSVEYNCPLYGTLVQHSWQARPHHHSSSQSAVCRRDKHIKKNRGARALNGEGEQNKNRSAIKTCRQ